MTGLARETAEAITSKKPRTMSPAAAALVDAMAVFAQQCADDREARQVGARLASMAPKAMLFEIFEHMPERGTPVRAEFDLHVKQKQLTRLRCESLKAVNDPADFEPLRRLTRLTLSEENGDSWQRLGQLMSALRIEFFKKV
eukprot:TRINITY_DN3107_c0_g1_i1.p1 TRINITY_DN3107_c0_g1~~TRINITY_DN3107_c0_g1_i1.p1  ORF type:complete len:142 (-),score=20.47 TRINITY_DN3107_c0_g1_i1:107-532(-)